MKLPVPVRRVVSVPWRHAWSLRFALTHRELFSEVASYCQFIGYPRSGHTLVYALLNAHPEVVLSNELGVLQWLRLGFSRNQLYSMILRADRTFTARGSRFQGYDYQVPNQWQGRFRRIRVIGDKDGGRDTARLGKQAALLKRLRRRVGVPLRLVHVIRNPYDTITTVVRRRNQRGQPTTIEETVRRAGTSLDTVARILQECQEGTALTLRHEDLIREPILVLQRLCAHVGVEASEEYLKDCASIVFPTARKTRDSAEWTPSLVARVQTEIIDRYEFLKGYSREG